MISLRWEQVNTWRLNQHSLAYRLPRQNFTEAVRRVGGIQAQVMSAAELAIAARVDGLHPNDVQDALWKEHTLVKTWLIRQTLHLIPAVDLPLFVAARRITNINWPAYFTRFGVSKAIYEEYLLIGPEILGKQPMTRQQFANAVGEHLKSQELYNLLVNKSWGNPLKPLAWSGELCFGPNDGQNVTFVRPRAWIGSWEPLEPETAMSEIVRHYLQAYGPSRPDNFRIWWGTYIGPAKQAFNSIAPELEEVDVEGWRALALRASLEKMQNLEPGGTINLLPLFDAFTFGMNRGRELEPLLPLAYQKQVYRPQGWISAVVLVDGVIKGTWEYKEQKSQTKVTVSVFSSISDKIKQGIAVEAERLSQFLNTPITLEFNQE